MYDILRNSLILDTETLGLERGAGMHELAFMDLDTKSLTSFVLTPNAVTVQTIPQEHTKLAGSAGDQYTGHKYSSWKEALHALVERGAGKQVPHGQTMELLKQQQPWLYKMLKHYPHLVGAPKEVVDAQNAARTSAFEAMGIKANLGKTVSPEDALGALRQAMSGKTVWIANAVFESKQVGAQLGALGPEVADQFKRVLETRNPESPDPFYVTGSNVTRARVLAQETGDWTGVWKAYVDNTPKSGETAVRDIQDVTRALHSYGAKLGFTDRDLNYLGTGIDISHRLHAIAAQDTDRINIRESHRAAEDVAVHERYVLERNVKLVSALQEVAEGTEAGRKMLEQGQSGPLGEVSRYFEALEVHGPALMRAQALGRLQRAQEDILRQGYTSQRQGGMPYMQHQLTPQDEFASAWRTQSKRSTYNSMEQVTKHLEAENRYSHYGVDVQEVWNNMKPQAGDELTLGRHVEAEVEALRSSWSQIDVGGTQARLSNVINRPSSTAAVDVGQFIAKGIKGRGSLLVGAAAALAGSGAIVGALQSQRARPETILHYGYDEWVEQQRLEGMSEAPDARARRHSMTDFGSPYQGPVGVQQVFLQQELLAEREKWLRAQYGARHYGTGIPSLPSWNPFIGGGYDFVKTGDRVAGADYAMRGELRKINIKDGGWKITADDADTVTIKRGGLVGSLQSFFGLNKSYSFRLAGLDSTETAHGDRAAQPFANQAKNAFATMLNNSANIDIIFDPNEVTYGRALGAVYADGRNLNYELVKRGLASHLPFGKAEYASIDYGALKEAEERAYATNRGMWSQPWARSFYEHSKASRNRTTFNQLANPKSIVKNSGTMMMISAMENAQARGHFSQGDAQVASELGSAYNVGADHVGPHVMSAASTPSTSYLQEQLQDLAGFIRTKGRNGNGNKLSHKSGYGRLNAVMAMDTLGTSNQVESRRRQNAFQLYGSEKALNYARKRRMAQQQRAVIQAMHSASPIGHHRM